MRGRTSCSRSCSFRASPGGTRTSSPAANAKLTTGVLVIYDGDAMANPFGDGLGITGFESANDDPYVALRAQFQLLF